jgi:ABC-type dipeptide/oligopeptide/nickel transport system ATPase component
MPEPLLSVDRLTTGFDSAGRFVPAVIDVSLHLDKGETLCLVGESGSGKSLTAFSIMGLVEPPGRVDRGTVLFKGRDLLRLSEREMQGIRGREIALVFQEPMTALNPVFSIGSQIEETCAFTARRRGRLPARRRSRSSRPCRFRNLRGAYAIILTSSPVDFVSARSSRWRSPATGPLDCRRAHHRARCHHPGTDPGTAARSPRAPGLALLLITHDLGVVAEMADRVAVMYAAASSRSRRLAISSRTRSIRTRVG